MIDDNLLKQNFIDRSIITITGLFFINIPFSSK